MSRNARSGCWLFVWLQQSVVRRVIGSGFGDLDEHVEFQGEGGSNGLSATQAKMTSLHAVDHIRQSVNGSTDRNARAGIGQFLTPAAIAQFMASLPEGGHQHVRAGDSSTDQMNLLTKKPRPGRDNG